MVSPALRGWNSWKRHNHGCSEQWHASHQPSEAGIVGNEYSSPLTAMGFVSPALRGWNSWKLHQDVLIAMPSSVSPALRGWNSWKQCSYVHRIYAIVRSHQPSEAGIVGNRYFAITALKHLQVSPALRGWNSWKLIVCERSDSLESHQPSEAGIVGNSTRVVQNSTEAEVSPALRGWNSWKQLLRQY